MPKPKIAIISPMVAYRTRGAGSMALWIIEALKQDYELSLVTTGRPSLERLNRTWGTSIAPDDLRLVRVPPFFVNYTDRFTTLRGALLARFCRRIAPRFEAMFSTYGVMDFGRPGIQYIGDFLFAQKISADLYPGPDSGGKDLFHRNSFARRAYNRLGDTLYTPSWPRILENLTLVNSEWTRRMMRAEFGLETVVVYPPVPGQYLHLSWEERECGFVLLAKLSPIKQIDRAVDILSRVRQRGRDVHLHIVGWEEDRLYARQIRDLCDRNREWCSLEGGIYGEEKIAFLSRHKYGLNTTQYEAFGVAVAEMVKAGCVVFVPDNGGQVEIVNHPALQFADNDDAAAKIEEILRSPAARDELRTHLARQGEKFGVSTYMAQIREVVGGFLRNQGRSRSGGRP